MNYIKLQTNLLKQAEAHRTRGKAFDWHYGTTEEHVYITDGRFAVRIPTSCFYLDINRVFSKQTPMNSMPVLFEKGEAAQPAERTGKEQVVQDKRRAVCFETAQSDIWVDIKFLEYFDNDEYTSYRATDYKSPVYIYEGEELAGLVLPMIINKERP